MTENLKINDSPSHNPAEAVSDRLSNGQDGQRNFDVAA